MFNLLLIVWANIGFYWCYLFVDGFKELQKVDEMISKKLNGGEWMNTNKIYALQFLDGGFVGWEDVKSRSYKFIDTNLETAWLLPQKYMAEANVNMVEQHSGRKVDIFEIEYSIKKVVNTKEW